MGSSRKTCLQKPLTIIETASSAEMPALLAVEELVFADLGGRGFMLHLETRCSNLKVGKGVSTALVSQEQRVALGVIARTGGPLHDLHQPAVGILPVARGDAF